MVYSTQNKKKAIDAFSSHLSPALPLSNVTLTPAAISQCISQDLNPCQRQRVSVFPDLVSCYWFARAYCDFKLGQVPRYAKDLMGPLKSEIRSRPSGGTSLTDPESRPKVPKHFFKPMPAELRQAKFCFDAVCFLILTISHLCAVFLLSKNFIVIHKSIHSFDYFFSLCRFNPLMIHFISLFLCGVFFWWHFVNSVSR